MSIKGIIFDFDGTLFNSMHIWRSLPVKVLEKNGIKTDEDINRLIYSMNIRQAAEFMVKKYGVSKTREEIIKEASDVLQKAYSEEIEPKPGALEFLEKMRTKGIRMFIATAAERSLILPALRRFDMEKFFEGILTTFEVGKSKEFADIYIQAQNKLGLSKDEVVVFEDAAYCIKTAKNEGFCVVGVSDESEEDKEFVKNNADYFIENFYGLRDFND